MPRGCGAMTGVILYGILANKVDERVSVAFGLFLIGIAGIFFGFLNLDIATINIGLPNYIYGFGMTLAMIPIIALSVVTLKNSQMTNATGIQNMLKNIGGAVGTSVATTLVSRFSQIHQAYMVDHLNPLNPVYIERLTSTAGALAQYTQYNVAQYMAEYSLYGSMVKQASLWGFMEAFRICGILALVIIPLLLLLKKIK